MGESGVEWADDVLPVCVLRVLSVRAAAGGRRVAVGERLLPQRTNGWRSGSMAVELRGKRERAGKKTKEKRSVTANPSINNNGGDSVIITQTTDSKARTLERWITVRCCTTGHHRGSAPTASGSGTRGDDAPTRLASVDHSKL